MEAIKNIPIVEIIEQSGVVLKKYGSRHRGFCPFHNGNSAAFFVYDDNRFYCFGCEEHGDAADFVQKLHGLSFKDALSFLGIDRGPLSDEKKAEIEQRKKRAQRVRAFRKWEEMESSRLGRLLIDSRNIIAGIKIPKDLEAYGSIYHALEVFEYHMGILIDGNDEARFELFRERNGISI